MHSRDLQRVMAGLVPAIHDLNTRGQQDVVDARHEAGHDDVSATAYWMKRVSTMVSKFGF